MALDIRTGQPSQTGGSIIARPSTAATITVTVAGQTLTAETDTTQDNVTRIDVAGLSAGRSYPYTVTCNGESASGELQTLPSSGLRLAFSSCMDSGIEYVHGHNMIGGRNHEVPHLFIDIGDFPYIEFARGAFGVVTQQVSSNPTDIRAWCDHYLQVWRNNGLKALCHKMHWLGLPDDHQWPGNDVCATYTAAPNGMNYYNTITTNQTEHDAYLAAGADYYRMYYQGTPWTTDAGQTSAAGELYWTLRPNDDVELFGLCQIPYRTSNLATDNASKTLLGAAQKAWFKAALSASTARWKIIMSPKQTYPDAGPTAAGDGWGVYTTERTELLDYITANGITNVLWMVGDRHVPNMVEIDGHIAMNACPGGQNVIDTGDGFAPGVIWRPAGYTPATHRGFRNYGYVEISPGGESATLMMVDERNNVMWQGTVAAESGAVSGPTMRY